MECLTKSLCPNDRDQCEDIQCMDHNGPENRELFLASVPILVYHRIIVDDSPRDPSGFAMPVSQFERQMRYLHDRGYRCLSLTELLQLSRYELPQRDRAFVLTFDDGYEDFLTHAYPILRRYRFTATVFLITDWVRKESHRRRTQDVPMLTWEQVRALHDEGISFGSHTCTHPHLPDLSSEEIWYELTASKQRLEAELGQEISVLAYPYGESNSEVRRLAVQADYEAACGVIVGKRDRFNLWRWPCRAHDTLLDFALKVSPCYHYLMRLRRWVREDVPMGQFLRRIKHSWLPQQ